MRNENEIEYMKLSKKDFDKIKLVPGNNKVLLRKLTDNINQTTKSGVYISPKPLIQNLSDHFDRVFEVVQIPKKLRFEPPNRRGDVDKAHMHGQFVYFWTPAWKAQVEIKKGDIVISAKIQIPKSVHIRCEEEEYVLLDYHELYLAFRPMGLIRLLFSKAVELMIGKENTFMKSKKIFGMKVKKIIPLNGFVICKTIKDYLHSDIIILLDNADERIKRGEVVYAGKPNLRYMNKRDSDKGIDLKKGDIIYKRNTLVHRDLENVIHSVFDRENEYFVIQRKDIIHVE